MAPALRNAVVALAGDFGAKRTTADLKRWIEAAGGEWRSSFSAYVTHLVCSKDAWKNKNAIVKSALKQKKTKIVTYDWLEDSCMKKSRQSETKYLWKSLDKAKVKKKTDRKKATKAYIEEKKVVQQFQDGCKQAAKDLHSDNHHYYRDSTGFVYNIVLINPDRPQGMMPHYCLRLYETNTRPHQYAVTLSHHLQPSSSSLSKSPFSTSHSTPSPMLPTTTTKPANILTPMGSPYQTAYATFRHAFRKLTGVDWDFRIWSVPNYRVESRSPPPRSRSSSPEQQPSRVRKKDLPKANADGSTGNEPLMDGVVRAPGYAPFALNIPARIAAQREADRTVSLIGGWGVRAVDQAIEEGEKALLQATNAAAAGPPTSMMTTKPVEDQNLPAGMLDLLKSELERDRVPIPPPQPMRTTAQGLGVGPYQPGGHASINTALPNPIPTISSSDSLYSNYKPRRSSKYDLPPDPFASWRKSRPCLSYKPAVKGISSQLPLPPPPPPPPPAPITFHQTPTQHQQQSQQQHPKKKHKTEKHYHTYALPVSGRQEPLGELGMRESAREWFGNEGLAGWTAWKGAVEEAGGSVDGHGHEQGSGNGNVRVRVGGGIKD